MKKIIRKIYNENIPLRENLYRMILAICAIALGITVILTLATRQGIEVWAVQGFGLFLVLTAFFLNVRFRIMDAAAIPLMIIVHVGIVPPLFLYGGGVESSSGSWILLVHVLTCVLLVGKARILVESLGIVVTIGTYAYAYRHPEMILALPNQGIVYMDCAVSFMIIAILIVSILTVQDNAMKKEQKKIREQKEEIERIGKAKDVFFASMSHEIRTPINTIIGLNEMNLREDISTEIAENSLNIQKASKMLLSLINDILDLSKIETGKMEIVPVQYETGGMFSDVVNVIWVRANEKKLNFRVNISEEMPSMLYGDEVRIKQIMMNLLNNAVKYTPKGEVVLTAGSERIDSNRILLRISVSDTGIGIKKENLEKLFDSFQRVDQEKNRNIEGTGLGLSITRQLVDLMGGKITVDSIYTKGSTFTVLLEQKIVDEKPIGLRDFTVRSGAEDRKKYKTTFTAPEARVLVVDDNSMNLTVAKKLLRGTKVQVDTASSGRECLKLTQQNFYHAIFMDHMMPVMDGIETMEQLRRQPNGLCRETPVIALTANAGSGVERIYQEHGFMGYLAKPINGALFEAILLKYLPKELIEYAAELDEREKMQDGIVHVFKKDRKKPIAITTDCTCDLPVEWLNALGIRYQCNIVHLGERKYRDFTEITADNLIEYMEQNENCKIFSLPDSVESYENFFASALSEANEVIHITVASGSGIVYSVAKEASETFDNVHVVDSGHLSSGLGLMVLQAAMLAREEKSAQEICAELERMKQKVSTSFMVPNANAMYQSGKVGKGLQMISESLDMRMVLQLVKGKIVCRGVYMGRLERCRRRYVRKQLKNPKKIDTSILFLTYAGCSVKEREKIKKEISRHVQFERIVEQKASASISSFCGAGVVALMFKRK